MFSTFSLSSPIFLFAVFSYQDNGGLLYKLHLDEQEQHGGVTVLKLKDISQYRMVASIQHKLLSLDNRQLDSEVILNGRTMSKEDLMVKAAEYGKYD